MTLHPRFKPSYRVEILPDEGVFLISERETVLLTEPAQIQLAPWLTGEFSVSEITDRCQEQISPQEIAQTLLLLRSQGHLIDASADAPREQLAFQDFLEKDESLARERLQQARISLTTFGDIDTQPLISLLEELGLEVGTEKTNNAYRVVLTDDELREGLAEYNDQALAQGQTWLLTKPVGRTPWLGPLFVPEQTACWQCLAHRRRALRKVDSFLQKRRGASEPLIKPRAELPSTRQTALGLIATEIYKWVVRGQAEHLTDGLLTLDLLTFRWHWHHLVKRPQCPACGTPRRTETLPEPLVLRSRTKNFTADGGHRSATPDAVFRRLSHHISPITGIVASLHPGLPGQQETLVTPSSYIAEYSSPHVRSDLPGLLSELSLRAGGKGRTHEQAKMSALGEAIERYSGSFQGDEPRVRARLHDLGEDAIHPNLCMNYSSRQYAAREERNPSSTRSTWIAEPFDESKEVDWSPVHSLTHTAIRYLPTAYCYYGYQDPTGKREFARADSNGCAAGSNKEEAILQGFLEVVERDSVAIWWYNRLQRSELDLDSFEEPYIDALRTHYRKLNRDLWVLDVSSDLRIPVFAAISRRIDKATEDIILGFGAHLDPSTALLRALTELNQSLPPVAQVTADGKGYLGVNENAIRWWRTATLAEHPYLKPASKSPRPLADLSTLATHDLRDDVLTCIRLAQDQGLETLVLDQTRADVGLSVVKVIVPGMRHFWPRLGPGRLYDVPVKMGWLEEPLREDQVNGEFIYF